MQLSGPIQFNFSNFLCITGDQNCWRRRWSGSLDGSRKVRTELLHNTTPHLRPPLTASVITTADSRRMRAWKSERNCGLRGETMTALVLFAVILLSVADHCVSWSCACCELCSAAVHFIATLHAILLHTVTWRIPIKQTIRGPWKIFCWTASLKPFHMLCCITLLQGCAVAFRFYQWPAMYAPIDIWRAYDMIDLSSLTSNSISCVLLYLLNSFSYPLFIACKIRYDIPLVADIHFAPAVAMRVAEAFEKIRSAHISSSLLPAHLFLFVPSISVILISHALRLYYLIPCHANAFVIRELITTAAPCSTLFFALLLTCNTVLNWIISESTLEISLTELKASRTKCTTQG